MTWTGGNPRFILRAYETADCCRTAHLLAEMMAEGALSVSRVLLVKCWESRYPRPNATGRRRTPSARVGHALSILAAAGIIKRNDEGYISILNEDLLLMSSRNLDVVQGDDGKALPPSQWKSRPECPEYLRDVQQELIDRPVKVSSV